ncbi:hypothetical protein N8T08_005901 [Aspergillus melleus]|uniref:Uncharacterized protein n=1 Tax=Aspergillus melleus TaxID=138277 RepID=A0ACC3B0Y1_9EURO|nr:hypothetical protein N8T08_005901 [Aspergillus melleus]
MVMRKYTSSALDALCTQEQLDLLDSIDTLRSQGISHLVSLPQIIVCGDQSSGKSSVLEAISGVSFPVRSNLCTRFPTELVLRQCPETGVRVTIVPHHSRSEAERNSLGSFCEELNGFDGLPQLIDNAKAIMGITTHGKAFSNDILRVEISGPDRPHLTIVDLPGLIHSETKQQSAADVQLVQNVVQTYMRQPRSVILAVVSAKNDYANQIVLRLARDADKSGDRTLGVITKPDTLVEGSETQRMFISLARNQDVHFRLGWHALKNMDSDHGMFSLEERDLQECEFFTTGAWSEMTPSLVGISSLRTRLSKVLLRQIAAELPSLIEDIKAKRDSCRKQLERLGQPRLTLDEQRSYLLSISQTYQLLVKAAVDGTYNEAFFDLQSTSGHIKRMRAILQNLNQDFAERLLREGHHYIISEDSDEADTGSNQAVVTRDAYLQHIQELMKETRGRELPGTFNPMIVGELFLEQSKPWEEITQDHILEIWGAAKRFVRLVIEYISDETTSAILFGEVISPALDSLSSALETRSKKLLAPHRNGHPITYSHGFTEALRGIRASRHREGFAKVIREYFQVGNLHEQNYINSWFCLDNLLQPLTEIKAEEMVHSAPAQALDCMLAYYKAALERFIDDVAVESIELELAQALTSILSPIKVFEMAPELVTRIAGESEENRAFRMQLNKKLQVLANGLVTCQQFVGNRGLDPNHQDWLQANMSKDNLSADSDPSTGERDVFKYEIEDLMVPASPFTTQSSYDRKESGQPTSGSPLTENDSAEFEVLSASDALTSRKKSGKKGKKKNVRASDSKGLF